MAMRSCMCSMIFFLWWWTLSATWGRVVCLFTALVMVLQIKRFGKKSDDIASFSKSCFWVSDIDSSVSHSDIFVPFMRWSKILFKQSPLIYLATMLREDWWSSSSSFIIFHVTCMLSWKKIKDQKLGADSMTKASLSYNNILIKAERYMACSPSSG